MEFHITFHVSSSKPFLDGEVLQEFPEVSISSGTIYKEPNFEAISLLLVLWRIRSYLTIVCALFDVCK
jgi:hypothetical protein